MNCLIVNGDWIDRILSGEKTVETSGQALTRGFRYDTPRLVFGFRGRRVGAPRAISRGGVNRANAQKMKTRREASRAGQRVV